MNEFNLGDRVICLIDSPDGNSSIHKGSTGTICFVDNFLVGVCWDSNVGGHDCRGECEYGFGWNMLSSGLDFEPEDNTPPFQFDDEEFRNLFR